MVCSFVLTERKQARPVSPGEHARVRVLPAKRTVGKLPFMQDLLTVLPFALVGLAIIIFGLVLNRQSTLSARRLDAMIAAQRSGAKLSSAEPRMRTEIHF